MDQLTSFQSTWAFTRSLTIDLLNSLTEDELLWSPGHNVGEFWKQFRHVGRVQENYLDALETRVIKFSCADTKYFGGSNKTTLLQYLEQLDKLLLEKVIHLDFSQDIDWFGETVPVKEHLARLIGHETLHHGQWIVYCKLLRKNFPESWSVWGL